ncbi:hypothetical protein BD289DRAFT_230680 [Coniella lustricola]|uniref:Uncharacterized protein n=1 Tax=Coniella lustricola TaxID=2025994 RepID=A0A2T3AAF0_9PEZI|nr:hypothetical protein BD289DRAFT_230680 [Coniella lustricola]
MSTTTALTALVFSILAVSPARCLPKPGPRPIGIVDEIQDIDAKPNGSKVHMSNAQVIGLSIGIFVGVLLLCCLGGACETILCTKRSRHDPTIRINDGAADALQPTNTTVTTISSSSKTSTLNEKKADNDDGQGCLNLGAWKKGTTSSTSSSGSRDGRFSWYGSNSVAYPNEPENNKRVLRVVNVDGYETSANMSSYNAQTIHGPARSPLGGLPLVTSPQFLIGDEDDEAEFERDMALRHAVVSAGPLPGADYVDHRTRAGAADFEHVPVSPLSRGGSRSSSPTAIGSGCTTPTKGMDSRQSSWKAHGKKGSEADDDNDWSSTYSKDDRDEQPQEHVERPATGRRITHVFPWMPAEDEHVRPTATMPRVGRTETSSSEETLALTHPPTMDANRI